MKRAWAKEPLLHFVIIGAALFAVDAARGPDEPDEPARRVVVDRGVREELRARRRTELSREPTEAELEEVIDHWVNVEILYREGLRRGFDEHDPAVRARVASRMGHVLRASAVPPEPSERALRRHLEAHADDFAEGERVDFTHVFVGGHDADAARRADELLALLERGASPAGLGDSFSGGRRYRGRELEDLARIFGDAFVEGMSSQPIGTWARRRSRLGFHLVRIDRRIAARTPRFEEIREDVRHDFLERWEADAEARAMTRLRAEWEVVEAEDGAR